MKKVYALLSLTVIVLAILHFTGVDKNIVSEKIFVGPPKDAKYDEGGRKRWEKMRLADPLTGEIPVGIRARELAFAAGLPQMQTNPISRMQSNFVSRGPFNVGGRTRAIAIDVTNENIMFAGSVNGGLWRSSDAGASWTRVSSLNDNPAVTWIVQDKRPGHTNKWYYSTGEGIGASASASGAYFLGNGIYKSTDGGLTWNVLPSTATNTPQTFDQPYDITFKLVCDPSSTTSDVLYMACYGSIYKSSNGGTNWTIERGGSPYSYFSDVDVTSNGTVYATLDSDGGQKGVWRKDVSLGWFNVSPPGWDTATYGRVVIGVSPSNENVIYFLGETPFNGKMNTNWKGDPEWNSLWKYTYISGNGTGSGGMWQDLSQNLPQDGSQLGNFNSQGGYNLIVAVHPTDTNVVFIGGTNLYRSTDGFSTSNNTTLIGGYDPLSTIPFYGVYPNHHSDQHNIVFMPSNPDVMLQANDGGLNFTNNCRANPVVWDLLNNGYNTSQFYTVAIDHGPANNDIIIGGLQDYGTWFTNTTNGQAPWVHPGLGDGAYCAIDDGHNNYYMSRQEGKTAKVSLDANGNVLGFRRIDPIGASGYLFINPFILDPNDNNIMYMAAGNKLWRNDSLNIIPLTGEWDTISTGWFQMPDTMTVAGMNISAIAAARTPANRVYIGTNKRNIYRIENANSATPVMTDISSVSFPTNGYVSCIAIDPNDGNKIIVTFSNYNIYSLFYSPDAGATWQKIGGNLEANSIGTGNGPSVRWATIVPTSSGNVYFVGTSTGLYATNNLTGLTTVWTQMAPNEIGKVVVDMMDFRSADGLLAVATHGAGVFSAYITDTLTTSVPAAGISLKDIEVFPNPASIEFRVKLYTPQSEKIHIRLFSIDGKESRTIFSGTSMAGLNQFTVKRENLSTGVYILKAENSSGKISTKKIVIR
ncbi:MAG: T9SS C-terminal target domain-containing protein [Bacteroidetes bacterium]|nr:MAG: T9SS C-terminal target domain-containing protein [Bacteroidota bacterium]REK00706.1 MAG: T9SS C-terminal target domain-containing protein [Bacteroidota bacterium]REK35172.1 MAG: T9SS C-terminal target domain-containing protein [Bacteroidota bacterium]REK48249.1 MAG: T9SS C-terminal target domain-containing protein [Bacteroidota bacterium]